MRRMLTHEEGNGPSGRVSACNKLGRRWRGRQDRAEDYDFGGWGQGCCADRLSLRIERKAW